MKRHHLLYAAAGLLLLASCTNDNDWAGGEITPPSDEQVAIEFGTYMGRQATTRAEGDPVVGGKTKAIDDVATLATADGFGVIAYYTDNTDFASWTKEKPNFMYNEHIKGTTTTGEGASQATTWDYATAANKKYWPNDISTASDGEVDTQAPAATGDAGGGKLSFFAYAPYVNVATSGDTGRGTAQIGETPTASTVGIKALSANNVTDKPFVQYKLDAEGKNVVDLLWGTAGGTDNGENVLSTSGANNGKTLTGGLASVNVDLTKQKTKGKVKFDFKHALARIGGISTTAGLQVQLDIDNEENGNITGGSKNDNTKVTLKSITIKTPAAPAEGQTDEQINIEGKLDLTTGLWTEMSSAVKGQVTHTIGNATATETTNQIKTTLAEPTTDVTAWTALNDIPGVTTEAQNVYLTENAPFYIIPIAGTNPKLTFTVEYVVRTKDDNLDKGFSVVTQKITKTIQFDLNGDTEGFGSYQANNRYNIVMHLGLTSVKFTASVSAWDSENAGDVHLPINVATVTD